jgi:cobaltochelatase CobN
MNPIRAQFALIALMLLTIAAPTHAADNPIPRIAFLGIWDRSAPLVEKAMRETAIPATTLKEAQVLDTKSPDPLKGVDVLLILNLHAETLPALKQRLTAARTANPKLKIIALDRRGIHAALDSAGLLEADKNVPAYWVPNGATNMAHLLEYCDKTYLGGKHAVEPPIPVPDCGFYIPGRPDEAAADVASLKAAGNWKEGNPIIALLIQQSFWVTQDLKVVDAEAAALRQRGFNVAVTFAQTATEMESLLENLHPDLLAEDRHGTLWAEPKDGKTMLERLDVPYLRPVSMLAYTNEEWLKDPRGMHPRDVGGFVAIQESKGTIEPLVVGGLKAGISGYKLHEPIPDRIEHFADRAWSWVNLRRKPEAQKRIAFIYYNSTLGKDDLMRGTPTGGFLDGPESFMRLLPELARHGYTLENAPKNTEELIHRVRDQGRNIGPWAQGEVEAEADKESSVLVPLDQYLKWFNSKLGDANRQAVIKAHGPPPGKLMVVERNGQKQIVIPTIRLGNILLAPQPVRGEAQDEKLLHSRDVPPPHNYLAFYWWLQEGFHADAIVHWGTHGSLELLPGKATGLSRDDWPDICAGTMPIINLWIMDNLGEATFSRRRSYALLVDHLCPPAVKPGLSNEAGKLHEDIEKFDSLGSGALREEFRKRISAAAREQRIDETLHFPQSESNLLSDAQMTAVHDYLHQLLESRTPTSLHVLGQNPDSKLLPDYLVAILHKPFLDRVAALAGGPRSTGPESAAAINQRAQQIVKDSILSNQPPPTSLEKDIAFGRDVLARLNQSGNEITNLLRALDARYIAPGPGPDPIRNPASVPTGRNLYALNPEEIPTRASWEVARKLVDDMLKTRTVHKVGIDLSGMSTMQDYGVTEGQILYLMGVRPVWDQKNRAIDVQLIPREELTRPRVDVFIALGGSYKENFPSRVKLIDKAIRLAAEAREADNGVRSGSLTLEADLLKKGFSSERAHTLSVARIFGTKLGAFGGTNILYLAPRSGAWNNDDDIASVYIDNMSYVYTGDTWGQKIDGLYERAIQGTDTLVRTWSSNLTSQLSNHHAYEYLGGMSMAVTKLTGKEPAALIADVRDPDGARMRDFNEVMDTDFRTQLLNPNWIAGMKQHDYAGAGQIAELLKNTFGWQVTRRSAVSDGTWNDIYETYIQDRHNLGLPAWMDKVNPHARQEVAATMLEAARKRYWNATPAQLAAIANAYAESVAKYGPSDGLVTGGNTQLQQFVAANLKAPGKQPLVNAFNAAMAKATTADAPAPGSTRVIGQQLKPDAPKKAVTKSPPINGFKLAVANQWWPWALGGLLVALFFIGILRKSGGAA